MKPVSVIIPTRERPELVRRALHSIEAQVPITSAHPVSQVIVVFDQSAPDAALISEFEALNVVLIENDRSPGLAGARNSGIEAAKTDWIAFCDDDDWWTPTKLRDQAAAAVAHPHADFIVGNITIRIGERSIDRSTKLNQITFADLLHSRVMEAHPSTFLVRRSAIEDYIGVVDEDLPGSYAEDYDWLIRAARVKPIAVAPQRVTFVQWHERSFFGNRWQMIDEALEYLIDKTPEFRSDPHGLARISGQRAFAQAAIGDRSRAMSSVHETVRLNWREPRAYLAVSVVAGLVSAERLVGWANRLGRGI